MIILSLCLIALAILGENKKNRHFKWSAHNLLIIAAQISLSLLALYIS